MDLGLLLQVAVVVGVLAALWVLPDWGRHRDRARRAARRLHVVEPEPPRPAGPPIERIAADARRIRGQIRSAPPGFPVARMRGWVAAYDEVLVAACTALQLEQRLDSLTPGPERELERERVERMLVRAGVLVPWAS
ncbi:hypothetical protein [Nocardioides solisilvae]|uniref:hypothetical protein n=1 Tax=Nocardioides solisilvae TaxID=1542435 RepID=UPI000D748F8F|nr:hypothetical protein [Nocardioides solisilvae]